MAEQSLHVGQGLPQRDDRRPQPPHRDRGVVKNGVGVRQDRLGRPGEGRQIG